MQPSRLNPNLSHHLLSSISSGPAVRTTITRHRALRELPTPLRLAIVLTYHDHDMPRPTQHARQVLGAVPVARPPNHIHPAVDQRRRITPSLDHEYRTRHVRPERRVVQPQGGAEHAFLRAVPIPAHDSNHLSRAVPLRPRGELTRSVTAAPNPQGCQRLDRHAERLRQTRERRAVTAERPRQALPIDRRFRLLGLHKHLRNHARLQLVNPATLRAFLLALNPHTPRQQSIRASGTPISALTNLARLAARHSHPLRLVSW